MNLLHSLANEFNLFVAATNASESIVTAARNYIGPFLLLFVGVMIFKFVKDQQMMGLITFIIIALVVIIVFYAPGVLKSIAGMFVGETSISKDVGSSTSI